MKRLAVLAGLGGLMLAYVPDAPAQCCPGGHAQHGNGGHTAAAPGAGHASGSGPAIPEPAPTSPRSVPAEPARRSRLPADPVSGAPIDFSLVAVDDDGPVYFSSPQAMRKFKDDPRAYAAGVDQQRAALGKLPRIQVNCPVTGNPIDDSTFFYTGEQAVYFCSEQCRAQFRAERTRYKTGLAASFTYQTRCPVSGETIDPAVYTDRPNGQRIYLCSRADVEKFALDPGRYAARLAAQGIRIQMPARNDPGPDGPNRTNARPSAAGPEPGHGAHGTGGVRQP